MKAIVVRSGVNKGVSFIEVDHEGLRFGVPVSEDIPVNTEVDISVVVSRESGSVEVVASAPAPLVVPDSPIVSPVAEESVAPVEEVVSEEAPAAKKGKLPEDFPGHAALETAGITTFAQLRKAGDVTEVEGIGPATAEKINEALNA